MAIDLLLCALGQTSNQDELPQIDTICRLFIYSFFLKYLLYIEVVRATMDVMKSLFKKIMVNFHLRIIYFSGNRNITFHHLII